MVAAVSPASCCRALDDDVVPVQTRLLSYTTYSVSRVVSVVVVALALSSCSGASKSSQPPTTTIAAMATPSAVPIETTTTTVPAASSSTVADSVPVASGPPTSIQRVSGVGQFPYHVISAFDSIWVLAKDSGTVTRLDATTGAAQATITLDPAQFSGTLNRLAAGTDAVYVSALPLIRIDPATNQITVISTNTPAAAVIADGDTVWTASYPRGPIQRIDPDGTIITLDLPTAPWTDLAISNGLVWAVSQANGPSQLIAFNGITGELVHDVPVAVDVFGYPVRLVADEDNLVIGVDTSGGSGRTGSILIVDPTTATVTQTIDLPARPEGIALTPHHIWTSGAVVNRDTLEVTPVELGFSLTQGPDGTIWATSPGTNGDGTAIRYTPGQFTE